MSEEIKVEEVVTEAAESMADYEDKLDKDAFEAPVWDKFKSLMENKEVIEVKVENAVKGGVITFIDGVRAFIPQSHIALNRIEDLASVVGNEIKVRVIEVEQKSKKLVLSARSVLREEARSAKRAKAADIPVGTVLTGKVESLQPYGAFIRMEDGVSGLVHVSQIAKKRVNDPADVLKVGEEVQVKVIAVKDGKLSLSIKALQEPETPVEVVEEVVEKVVIPKAENIATSLGDLLKGIKLN